MEQLQILLALLGLNQLSASIIGLLAIVLGYFAKRYFDLKNKLKEIEATHRKKLDEITTNYKMTHRSKIDDRLIEYAPIQIKALLEAYRKLYEGEVELSVKSFTNPNIIQEAEEMIMKPFTEFSAYLNDPTKSCIYSIHNFLEQFKYDPSENSIRNFKELKGKFYNDFIQTAIKTINQSVKEPGD